MSINFPIIFKKIYHSIFNKISFNDVPSFLPSKSKDKSFLKKISISRITNYFHKKQYRASGGVNDGVFIRRNRDETHGCRLRSRQGNLDRDKK